MYKKFAKYYDSIYKHKNYEAESEEIRALVKKYQTSGGKDMLDVACGTGNHIRYLKNHFNITGVDLDKYMLDIAKTKVPNIELINSDMRTFVINRQFDVILCLFSAIGHMKTYSNLEKAMQNFTKHLKPGGIMIIEPFVNPGQFLENQIHAAYVNEPKLKLARFCLTKRKGNIAVLNFHFLIGEKGKIRYFTDRQDLGMFEITKVKSIFRRCGLKTIILKEGVMKHRELFIGIKK